MRKRIALSVGIAAVTLATAGAAQAGPFLCPVVGAGTLNNPDKGPTETIAPPVGYSLLPGNNQAGENANPNAFNTLGPGDPSAGPGGNPDFSPIWPG